MSRKKTTVEHSMTAFFLEVTSEDGVTTGERSFVVDGVAVRQVLKDGKWVNVDPPPAGQARKVQSKVVRRKALPGPDGGSNAL